MNDTDEQNTQTRRIAIGIVLILLVAGGLAWYLLRTPAGQHAAADVPEAAGEAATVPPPAADGEPAVKHPLPPDAAPPAEGATPAPVDPDVAARTALAQLFDEQTLAEWLIPEQLARRLVATTDNLGRLARIEPLRPLKAPATPFAVQREVLDAATGAERITLTEANYARYDGIVATLSRTDMARAAALYRGIYPQLQRAWEDLGYPGRYFNDRVVEVIDHLLATPEPDGPIALEQPKVLFRFADPALEQRSAGQKLLLRMGVQHARVVKEKLREFRAGITSQEK